MTYKSIFLFYLIVTVFWFEPTFANDGDDNFIPSSLILDSHWREKVKQEKIDFKFNQYVTRKKRTPLKNTLYVQPIYQYRDKIVSFKLFNDAGKFYKPDIKNRKNYIGFLVLSIKLNPINESGNTAVTALMNAIAELRIQSGGFVSEVEKTNSKIVMTDFKGDFATAKYEMKIDGIVFNSLSSDKRKWQYNNKYSHAPHVLTLTQKSDETREVETKSFTEYAGKNATIKPSKSNCFSVKGPHVNNILSFIGGSDDKKVTASKNTNSNIFCIPVEVFGNGINIDLPDKLNCNFGPGFNFESYKCYIEISNFCQADSINQNCTADLKFIQIPLTNIKINNKKSISNIGIYNFEGCKTEKNTKIIVNTDNKVIELRGVIDQDISIDFNDKNCTNHKLDSLITGKISIASFASKPSTPIKNNKTAKKEITYSTNSDLDLLTLLDFDKIKTNDNKSRDIEFSLSEKSGSARVKLQLSDGVSLKSLSNKTFIYNAEKGTDDETSNYSVSFSLPNSQYRGMKKLNFIISKIKINRLIKDLDKVLEISLHADKQCRKSGKKFDFNSTTKIYISGKKHGYETMCKSYTLKQLLNKEIKISLIKKSITIKSLSKNIITTPSGTNVSFYYENSSCNKNKLIDTKKVQETDILFYKISKNGYQGSPCKEIKVSELLARNVSITLKKEKDLSKLVLKLTNTFYGDTFDYDFCQSIKLFQINSKKSLLFKVDNNGYIIDKKERNKYLSPDEVVSIKLKNCTNNIITPKDSTIAISEFNSNPYDLKVAFTKPFFLAFVRKAKWGENYGANTTDLILSKDSKFVRNGWNDALRSINDIFSQSRDQWQNGYLFDIAGNKLIELHETNSKDDKLSREKLFSTVRTTYNKMNRNSNLGGSITGVAKNKKMQAFDSVISSNLQNLWVNIFSIRTSNRSICAPERYGMDLLEHTKLLNIVITENSSLSEWRKTFKDGDEVIKNDEYIICDKNSKQVMTIIFSGADQITRASNDNDPNNIWKQVFEKVFSDPLVTKFCQLK